MQNITNNLSGSYVLINNLGPESDGYDTYASATANDGKGWEPIGGNGTENQFTGSFDGNGYAIIGLRINRPGVANVGLFGHIGVGAVIENLGLYDVEVVGGRGTGTLVGRVTGREATKIEFCYADNGTVTGDGATGGLVGSNNSEVETPSEAASHRPRILKSWANIAVSWSKSGAGDKFGGLTGCNQKGQIENSYARGSVTVDNSGDKDPPPERVGGLTGCINLRGRIVNAYSTGLVTTNGTVNEVGGFLGLLGTGTATNSFWDIHTSEQTISAGGTGKTTAEMKDEDTFTDTNTEGLEEAWDFTTIWAIDTTGEINDGYPYLRNNEPTLAVISAVRSRIEDGVAIISWDVELELETAGYYLERETGTGWVRINAEPLPALFHVPAPKTYELADPDAPIASVQIYRIIELEWSGATNVYGPFALALDGGEVSYATWAAGIDWGEADADPDADPDGDGLTNFQEYLAGTDPLSANCVLRIRQLNRTPDGLQIVWKSRPGRVYAIQLRQAESDAFMTVLTNIEASDGTETSVSIPAHDQATPSLFRVILVQSGSCKTSAAARDCRPPKD